MLGWASNPHEQVVGFANIPRSVAVVRRRNGNHRCAFFLPGGLVGMAITASFQRVVPASPRAASASARPIPGGRLGP